MIKLFLFDLGNVILPFEHCISVQRISRLTDVREKELDDYIFKAGLARSYERGDMSTAGFFGRLKKGFKLKISFRIFKPIWEDIFRSNEAMNDILMKLKGKFRLCLLSNTNELHFNYVKKKFKILNVFGRYYLSYKMHMLKPQPGIYLKVLSAEKIKPGECVYTDDIKEYVEAAGKLGIISIQFKSAGQFKRELTLRGIKVE